MRLTQLRLKGFRCFPSIQLTAEPGLNLIAGENGTGKTSLLEALLFLSRGRSFRGAKPQDLIRSGDEEFVISAEFCQLQGSGCVAERIGALQAANGKLHLRYNGESAPTRQRLARQIPMQVVDAELHKVIQEGASQRRRFMDWGVFHVEPGFYSRWRDYERALRHRNHALRHSSDKSTIHAWNVQLGSNAAAIDAYRRAYVCQLRQYFDIRKRILLPSFCESLTLEYQRGWKDGEPLEDVLKDRLAQDLKAGHTNRGAHRADIVIRVADQSARKWLSRGQQKLLYLSLVFAQLDLHRAVTGEDAILLLDDMTAELDDRACTRVIETLSGTSWQTFAALLTSRMDSAGAGKAYSVFHVEPQSNASGMV